MRMYVEQRYVLGKEIQRKGENEEKRGPESRTDQSEYFCPRKAR